LVGQAQPFNTHFSDARAVPVRSLDEYAMMIQYRGYTVTKNRKARETKKKIGRHATNLNN